MTFLSQNLEGLFVPLGTINPHFNFTTGFGPTFVRDAFIECINRNDYQIRAVLPQGDMILEEKFEYKEPDLREVIYIAYNEDHRWIFIYDITEDLGLLFCRDLPSEIVPEIDIVSADRQFNEVCQKWVKSHNAKHASSIQKWLNIRYWNSDGSYGDTCNNP